jgi:hypothetical protein
MSLRKSLSSLFSGKKEDKAKEKSSVPPGLSAAVVPARSVVKAPPSAPAAVVPARSVAKAPPSAPASVTPTQPKPVVIARSHTDGGMQRRLPGHIKAKSQAVRINNPQDDGVVGSVPGIVPVGCSPPREKYSDVSEVDFPSYTLNDVDSSGVVSSVSSVVSPSTPAKSVVSSPFEESNSASKKSNSASNPPSPFEAKLFSSEPNVKKNGRFYGDKGMEWKEKETVKNASDSDDEVIIGAPESPKPTEFATKLKKDWLAWQFDRQELGRDEQPYQEGENNSSHQQQKLG